MRNGEQILTAAEYRGEVSKDTEAATDSRNRCDTDGFLSQWASSDSSRMNSLKAEIVEAGMTRTFRGLYEGNRRVKAKLECHLNEWSHKEEWKWRIHPLDPIAKKRLVIPSGKNSRIQRSLGLRESDETAGAWARWASSGTGLSGSSWIVVFRTGDEWGQDSQEATR